MFFSRIRKENLPKNSSLAHLLSYFQLYHTHIPKSSTNCKYSTTNFPLYISLNPKTHSQSRHHLCNSLLRKLQSSPNRALLNLTCSCEPIIFRINQSENVKNLHKIFCKNVKLPTAQKFRQVPSHFLPPQICTKTV